jgi:nicotinate-nucleotide adenylyltransferase
MTRVGILGGTFNPIHLGHLRAAEEVCEALELDEMRLVPAAEPPHKRGTREDPLAPAELRLAWVRLACADNPRLVVDPLEVRRGGASFTVDTLAAVARECAPERPVFTIGCDAFRELESWREPGRVIALSDFAVMPRPGVAGGLLDWIPPGLRGEFELSPDGHSAFHAGQGCRVWRVEVSALDISSSDIRERLRRGRSVRYLLPEAVRREVEKSGVYSQRGAG